MSFPEEEVLGKAYDARLMRRLLGYMWPYRGYLAASALAIVANSLRAAGASRGWCGWRSTTTSRAATWPASTRIAVAFFALLLAGVRARVRADLGDADDRPAHHVRPADGDLRATCSASSLSYYDRNPVGRLMTRVTSDVDVLNDLFSSGVVAVAGDLFMLGGIFVVLVVMDWRLALVAFSVAAARAAGHPVVPHERARILPAACGPGSRASTRSCRRTSPGWRRCSCSGASA